MATDEVAQDVSQVTDFHFHTCRKFRLFTGDCSATSSGSDNTRNHLATSSQLGVTFALVNANSMVCFPTKSVLDFKVTRENMNVDVTDFPVKSVEFVGVTSVNDMGINSDGTLLAILHTHNGDVSVDVFDIKTLCSSAGPFKALCKTRVGTEPANQGTVLEWNPAFADTFAAASRDRSLLVAKIDVKNPSSQKLVGIGKLGAVTTVISWSPKGKQLTIGDSLGKVVQLKPELGVVRSQFGPDHQPAYGKVTGLCWLATTEWLVSFERGTDHDAYLMRCKKDTPTEWMKFHELSYSNSKWTLPAQLFSATELLVDWNVVLVGNSKTSEVSTIGKREDWQTWVPVEGETIYLPTTSGGKDTVPIGMAIDRTMTEEVSLKPDGSQKHRPSPLVLCLTNDGVLTAHHVISTFQSHNSCQLPSQNIPISGLAKPAAQTASPSAPFAQPSTVFDQKPKSEAAPAPAPTTPSLFATTPKATLQAPKPVSSSLFGAAPTSGSSSLFGDTKTPLPPAQENAPTPAPPQTPTAALVAQIPATPVPVIPPEVRKAEELAAQKKVLIERIQNTNLSMSATKDTVMKMSFAVGNAKSAVLECADVVKSSLNDSKEVTDELKNLLSSIEWMAERTKHTVKEMDFEIEEKMELVTGEEDGERILERLRDISETEKMMRFNKLETAADMLNGKYVECAEIIKKLRKALNEKETFRKQAVLSPLRNNSNLCHLRSGAEIEVALKVMRNVSKIVTEARERIQRTELEFVHFQRDAKNQNKKKIEQNPKLKQQMELTVLEEETSDPKSLTDAEIVKARQSLVARIQKRGPVKTRNVTVQSYKQPTSAPRNKEDPIDTANLSNAILKLSMTPRRVMTVSSRFSPNNTTLSARRDATTQADEPPVVKTVVVTVESPAKPAPAAPIVSTPLLKPATTTSTVTTSTVTTPTVKEEGKNMPAASPLPTSSSIFSGSLFGAKPTLSTTATSPLAATKPSIFESSLTSEKEKKPEEKKKTPEKPKQEMKEEPKVIEVKEETPKASELGVEAKVIESTEAPKVEEKAPELPVTEETTPKEKKDESATKTPSFSFNTSSSTPNSSIFGGGLKTQSTPAAATSSIFGAAAKSTPTGTAPTSSIFGGGAKPSVSPFGSFGQNSAQSTQGAGGAAPAQAAPVSFSFNTAASVPAKPSFGSFGAPAPAAKPSTVFGAAAAAAAASPSVPNVDDGMEDDSMVNGGGPGGFMSGLGSSGSTTNTSGGSNLFAPKPATGTSSNSWLFSGGNNQQQQQQQQQQKPSFSFNAPQQQTTAPTSSSSVFGGAPKFGSQPVFGAAAGGGLSKNASIFGGATASTSSTNTSGGFAQFATGQKTSSLFGGGAAAAGTQATSSIFGGGVKTNATPSSSIFGGGASTNANKPSSFTSWR
ncbi:unnamed protein product [Caenorhabditis sp. 36 PRJEB53466]|nr:unnamed protein product [Caenorhabditis sp. 36 PRJEB53466]